MGRRRVLVYQDWEAVKADLNSLCAGYTQHGNWNLEQTVRHLNDWLRFPLDGFQTAPFPMRLILFGMRATVGKRILRKVLAEGRMRDGLPTTPATVYRQAVEVGSEAMAQLLDNIDRFRQHRGPLHPSPVFGAMDKPTAERLQLIHFAHHLSWLTPKPAQQDTSANDSPPA